MVLTAEERKKLEKLKKRRRHVKSLAAKQGMQHNEVSDVISTFVSFYFISGAMTMPDSRGRQAKLAFHVTRHCHVPLLEVFLFICPSTLNHLRSIVFALTRHLKCVRVCWSVLQCVCTTNTLQRDFHGSAHRLSIMPDN